MHRVLGYKFARCLRLVLRRAVARDEQKYGLRGARYVDGDVDKAVKRVGELRGEMRRHAPVHITAVHMGTRVPLGRKLKKIRAFIKQSRKCATAQDVTGSCARTCWFGCSGVGVPLLPGVVDDLLEQVGGRL